MLPSVKKLWKGTKNNKEFIDNMLLDGDKRPGIFASDLEKSIFASIYYGWLLGKYGKDWKINI